MKLSKLFIIVFCIILSLFIFNLSTVSADYCTNGSSITSYHGQQNLRCSERPQFSSDPSIPGCTQEPYYHLNKITTCVWVQSTTPPVIPLLYLLATPSEILSGDSSTIQWESINTNQCRFDGVPDTLSGSKIVSPSITTSYTVSCYGGGGSSVSESVTVTVNQPQVTLIKTPSKVKNYVKAGVDTNEGKVYFDANISNIPANTTCRLKNLSKAPENQLITTFPGNSPYIEEIAHSLISGQNNFQVQCENSAGATTHSSNIVMTEGQSGTRGLQTCVIPENGNTCQTTMTWDTISPHSSYLTSFVSTNANIPAPASTNNGSHNFSLNQNTINSILSSGSTNGIASIINAKNKVDGENNGPVVDNQLFTVNLAVACDKGAWNGTMCKKHELAVTKNPMGGGSITMPDPGSTCDVNCVGSTISYNFGTSQTVTASPASGYTFSHWVNNTTTLPGDNCPNGSTLTSCTLKMNENRAVTAVFKQMTGTLRMFLCLWCHFRTSNPESLRIV